MSISREEILERFQPVTGFNIEDSIHFLRRYDWNLNDAVRDYSSSTALRGITLVNQPLQPLTSLAIMKENDQQFARILQVHEERSNGDQTTTEKEIANTIVMGRHKRIAIVAHNNKKAELIECLRRHRDILAQHKLYGTGTTGSMVEKELRVPVTKFESGPLGGDQQLGAKIASRELDILIFLIDPLDSHPHQADVQALLRLAQVYGIACAFTTASIDFMLSSPQMNQPHVRRIQSTSVPKAKEGAT